MLYRVGSTTTEFRVKWEVLVLVSKALTLAEERSYERMNKKRE